MVVYCDETNYNLYCSRTVGRARRGQRAVVQFPASHGANLQIQCAVSTGTGVVHAELVNGSIAMDANASFIAQVFVHALKSTEFEHCDGRIVIVIDNAPAHSQTEVRATEKLRELGYEDRLPLLVILRLGPYSPMLNPIEGCFSVLKARVKEILGQRRNEASTRGEFRSIEERKRALLRECARDALTLITPYLVTRMAFHSAMWGARAEAMEDMQVGA